jgi:hypothetical protein
MLTSATTALSRTARRLGSVAAPNAIYQRSYHKNVSARTLSPSRPQVENPPKQFVCVIDQGVAPVCAPCCARLTELAVRTSGILTPPFPSLVSQVVDHFEKPRNVGAFGESEILKAPHGTPHQVPRASLIRGAFTARRRPLLRRPPPPPAPLRAHYLRLHASSVRARVRMLPPGEQRGG